MNINDNLVPSREILIENTTACGANCIMCPRDKYDGEFSHMDMDLFKKAVDESIELGVISINMGGYGDCFMDPKFYDKLKYIKSKYPSVKITSGSTCHLINQDKLHLLKYISMLKISMYGFTKETYEKVHRGKLNFDCVIGNINEIINMPKSERPYIIMSFLLLPENKHELQDWLNYWEPKVDEILVWLPHNWAGAYEVNDISENQKNSLSLRSCGRPFTGDFLIHNTGEVSVCCFDFNKKLVIGNLREDNLKQILTSDKLEFVKEVHKKCTFNESDLLCKYCDQILDRSDALVYANNKDRKVGVIISHPDLINNTYEYVPKDF